VPGGPRRPALPALDEKTERRHCQHGQPGLWRPIHDDTPARPEPQQVAGHQDTDALGQTVAAIGQRASEPRHQRPGCQPDHLQHQPPGGHRPEGRPLGKSIPAPTVHDRQSLDVPVQHRGRLCLFCRSLREYRPGQQVPVEPLAGAAQHGGEGARLSCPPRRASCSARTASGSVDGHRTILIDNLERAADHMVERRQAVRAVVCSFERADVDKRHVVALQDLLLFRQVGAVVERGHILEPPVNHTAGVRRALLTLMPIPANDRGQASVDRDAVPPPVQPSVALGQHG